jgi:phosphatidylserine/phosphatidylglycerophosphate/cardiolipin synthase-like enzyme
MRYFVMRVWLTAVFALLPFFLTSCVSAEDIDEFIIFLDEISAELETTPSARPVASSGERSFDYELYFVNPTCPPEEERQGGIDELIAADLATATRSIDIATFDLDSEPIINALIEAERRGVLVQAVVDDEHNPESTTNRLRRNGISVVEDQRSGLMHNKFIVVDGEWLWVGSMNFTTNDVYCNNNNMSRIVSSALAANYATEFSEMFNDREFGITSAQNTTPILDIGGVQVQNYFAAEDGVAEKIMAELAQAESEILFLAFAFTNNDIGDVVLERAEAGVTVRGVFEASGAGSEYSYIHVFNEEGLDNVAVRIDGNPRAMHHKVFVIDRQTVIYGSYNFSASAEKSNDENLLIIHDPGFAAYFVEEFEAVWNAARQ